MNTTRGPSIRPASRIMRSEALVSATLDETVVLLDVEKGRYYELNPVGASIWMQIESGARVAEVCEALIAKYEVAPEACRIEVSAFLAELLRLGAVRIEPRAATVEMAARVPTRGDRSADRQA